MVQRKRHSEFNGIPKLTSAVRPKLTVFYQEKILRTTVRPFLRPLRISRSLVVLGLCTAVTVAYAQFRPDAGTLLEPQLPMPKPAPPASARILLPDAKPAQPLGSSVRITPSTFRFIGNKVFTGEKLASLVENLAGQPTDLAGLTAAAARVTAYYRARGYPLTEVYLPEQAFAASGGEVTFEVVEVKIGRVLLELDGDGDGVSRAFIEDVLARQLKKGDNVTDYGLDKPVLLLRDLAGLEATATVEPGAERGQVNVRVNVKARGRYTDGSVSLDNYGSSTAGALRATAAVNISNLLERGDVLSASGQITEQQGSNMFRVGYNVPVGSTGTRIGVVAARLNYALGKQFAALGATGKADVTGLTVTQPLLRARENNLNFQALLEDKRLLDQTATPILKSERQVVSARLGLAGDFVDRLLGTPALSVYSVHVATGRLTLDPADLAPDQGSTGLQTAGNFNKINADYQRTQYVGPNASVHALLQTQWAYKNLNSAEKMSLGGPNGIRAYPVGESIGDTGALFSLEYRHQLPPDVSLWGAPISLLAFYDYGQVRLNQNGPLVAGAVNSIELGGAGVGAMLGRLGGRFALKTHLAWRTTRDAVPSADADRSPRAWLSLHTWF